MDKTFNELFDDFFKKNDIKKEDKLSDEAKDKAKKLIDILTKFTEKNIDGNIDDEMDKQLGTPDKIECFNEGDTFYERRIWYTPQGDFQKLIITNEPTIKVAPVPEKPLQQQLDEAVESENFEKAAAIRDEIKKAKRKKKITK